MPSSPEFIVDTLDTVATASAAATIAATSATSAMTVWEPMELGAELPALSPRSMLSKPFEVSATVGIPEAVLAPAREVATNAGYVAGWNRGHSAGVAEAAAEAERARVAAEQILAGKVAELERAAETLRIAARKLDAREATAADEVEQLVIDGAFTIAESLVGLTLSDDELRGRAAVARALALAPGKSPITVGLSPADAETMRNAGLRAGVELMVDPSLALGDSYARWGVTTADARITAGLARVRDLLAPTLHLGSVPMGTPQLGVA
jgi:flagellar biosynthesis/type III secretory pathway protein FliH